MKRRGEHDPVECSSRGLPLLECSDFNVDALGLGDGGHAGVGLDGEEFGASFDHLHRGDTGAGTRLEDAARTRRQHVVDQLVGVARTKSVVVLCRASK